MKLYHSGFHIICHTCGQVYELACAAGGKEGVVPISELRKVSGEAAKYRKRLRELEKKFEQEQKAAELAKMEETDRLKIIAEEAVARAEVLKKRADTVARRAAVIQAAADFFFRNPQDAVSIVDLEQIEVDDNGRVDEDKVYELVKSLAESRPYLIKV